MNASQFQKKLLSLQENMLNFALMLTGNKKDAQDLVQDTTIKALDNQDKFIDNVNFKGWVLTVMSKIYSKNYSSKIQSRPILEQDNETYNLNLIEDMDLEPVEDSFQINEIIKALDNLAEIYKIPFSMHIAGYRYSEIAECLNISLGTVKSRIFFARMRLKEKLNHLNNISKR